MNWKLGAVFVVLLVLLAGCSTQPSGSGASAPTREFTKEEFEKPLEDMTDEQLDAHIKQLESSLEAMRTTPATYLRTMSAGDLQQLISIYEELLQDAKEARGARSGAEAQQPRPDSPSQAAAPAVP